MLEKIFFNYLLKAPSIILNSQVISIILNLIRIELRSFIKLNELLTKKPERVFINNEKIISYIHSSPQFWPVNFSQRVKSQITLENISIKDYFIHNAEVLGASNLVLIDTNRVFYAMKDNDITGKYYFLDYGIIAYDNEKCFIRGRKRQKTIKSGIKLITNFSHNYFHVLYEVIPKLIKVKINDPSIPLLIDDILLKTPQYKNLLDIFNKEKRDYMPLGIGANYYVENLYYISDVMIFPPKYASYENLSSSDFKFDLQVLNIIRDTLLKYKLTSNTPKRIFISRPDKRCKNESKIFEFLIPYGFTDIKPEKLSLFEQITLFNQAEIIVGTTGAAFSNLIFCNSECKVVCFTNYDLNFSGFSTIAEFVGLEFIYMHETTYVKGARVSLHDSFEIDLENFKELFFSIQLN